MKHMNIKWLLRFAFLNFEVWDRPLETFNITTSNYQSKHILKIQVARIRTLVSIRTFWTVYELKWAVFSINGGVLSGFINVGDNVSLVTTWHWWQRYIGDRFTAFKITNIMKKSQTFWSCNQHLKFFIMIHSNCRQHQFKSDRTSD